MNMVQRVARAIADVDNKKRVSEGLDDFGVVQSHNDFARAAIEAMREPSREMMRSMFEAMFEEKFDGTFAAMIGAGFEAAIDAALQEPTR